jgi:hypothetical protein
MFKRGDRVIYTPFKGCDPSQLEHGIVKRMAEDGEHAFVLYHTKSMQFIESDVDHYTCASTAIADLSREDGTSNG